MPSDVVHAPVLNAPDVNAANPEVPTRQEGGDASIRVEEVVLAAEAVPVLLDSTVRPDFTSPGSANAEINGAVGYSSLFDMARDSSPPRQDWASPRWEYRRNSRRRMLPLPPMDSLPLSGFDPPNNSSARTKEVTSGCYW